jgi:hypothetical protein
VLRGTDEIREGTKLQINPPPNPSSAPR